MPLDHVLPIRQAFLAWRYVSSIAFSGLICITYISSYLSKSGKMCTLNAEAMIESKDIAMSEVPPDSAFPAGHNVTFRDSSYFLNHHAFPSVDEVRACSAAAGGGIPRRPPPAHLPTLGLLVKWGFYVSSVEGQCLWMLRRSVRCEIPVPEIYGWVKDGDDVFLFMERVAGVTLESRWDGLAPQERREICTQLHSITKSLRSIQPYAGSTYLGSLEPCNDFK